jgi:hypothetical protein
MNDHVLLLPGLALPAAVTHHALRRYGEHVRPHMYGYPDELFADMARLVKACGQMSPRPPAWVHENLDGGGISEANVWLCCGDIALVVSESMGECALAITTVLAKGSCSDVARASRNKRRSARTWGRRKASGADKGAQARQARRERRDALAPEG